MRPVDAGGCWSGCAVDDGGTPTFLYTGVRDNNLGEQTTCLAVGDQTLTTWQKFEGNPLVRTPTDLSITHGSYRDPYVWKEGDLWYQVIGTSVQGRGQALLYRSKDLRNWEYLNLLIPQDLRDTFRRRVPYLGVRELFQARGQTRLSRFAGNPQGARVSDCFYWRLL